MHVFPLEHLVGIAGLNIPAQRQNHWIMIKEQAAEGSAKAAFWNSQ